MSDHEQNKEEDSQAKESSQCCGEKHHHGSNDRCCGESGDWWEDRSIAEKILIGIGFGILGLIFLALIGLVTMKLWNALMPEIFGIKSISYWQTWGLLLLSFILLKNWDCSGEGRRQERKRKKELRRHMHEKCHEKNEAIDSEG
ncbi:MAG: hypothetical protein B6D68_00865 [spirochete symbiont of Stewartia floridana]|nr:MAG: hypothetical protein B6D68_00865 [spirochete symbiont of Stewartia floridana]